MNACSDPSSAHTVPRPGTAAGMQPDDLLALVGDIFESMPVALIVSDAARRILLANQELELLLGYRREDLIGRPVEVLVPEPARRIHALQHVQYVGAPVARQMGPNRDLVAQCADGRLVPVEIALKPLHTMHGTMVIATILDISARMALEHTARDTHAELERRVKERTAELERNNRSKQGMLDSLERARRELERLSRQDPLTGLTNCREFDARIALEQQRSDRNASPMCLAMLDLDQFKRVNDQFGHAVGDEVLRRISGIFHMQCRAIDVISRHGGEEFAFALPDTDIPEATVLCERVRHSVEAYDWRKVHPELQVTISIGVVARLHGEAATRALARADRLLYDAKRFGRNRVEAGPATRMGRGPSDGRPPEDHEPDAP